MVSIIAEWWLRLLLGLAGSVLISYAAYRHRSLSLSGALSAVVMGTGFIVLGTPLWFTLLIVFFVSSSFLSKWKRSSHSKQEAEQQYEKSGRRDAGQVWANGGIGLLLCVAYALFPHKVLIYGYIGVMAAVTADTWATEIGALSKRMPRSILTLKQVKAGTSGGITALGLAASLAGGLLIGLVAYLLDGSLLHGVWIGAAAGLLGSIVDSLIGAKWQAMYRCQICGKETERQQHCQQHTLPLRGAAWLNNDKVNLLSSIIAGGAAWLLSAAL